MQLTEYQVCQVFIKKCAFFLVLHLCLADATHYLLSMCEKKSHVGSDIHKFGRSRICVFCTHHNSIHTSGHMHGITFQRTFFNIGKICF